MNNGLLLQVQKETITYISSLVVRIAIANGEVYKLVNLITNGTHTIFLGSKDTFVSIKGWVKTKQGRILIQGYNFIS